MIGVPHLNLNDAPLSSLMDLTMNPKVTTTKGEKVKAHSLVRKTSKVEGRVRASGWGLGKLTSKSIYSHKHAQTKQQVG